MWLLFTVLQYLTKLLNADTSIWNSLKERLTRPSDQNIQDIYDGEKYQKWQGFLNETAHISFLLNTDGVAIFRSSKFSVWPVWIVINELPKSQRYYCYFVAMECIHVILELLFYMPSTIIV